MGSGVLARSHAYSLLSVPRVPRMGGLGDLTDLHLPEGREPSWFPGEILWQTRGFGAAPDLASPRTCPCLHPHVPVLSPGDAYLPNVMHPPPLSLPPTRQVDSPSAALVQPFAHGHAHPPPLRLPLISGSICLSLIIRLCSGAFHSSSIYLATHPPCPPVYSFLRCAPAPGRGLGLKSLCVWHTENVLVD